MADRRLDVLQRQLTSAPPPAVNKPGMGGLKSWLTHDNDQLRATIVEFLKDDIYRPNYYQSLMEFRAQTLERLRKYVRQRFFKTEDYLRDPRRFMAGLECLALVDYSLAIKAGVHFTLCGGTICKLGTTKHHKEYLHRLDDLSLPGCFGMTELGHGSNVMGIETTAHYDPAAREFVINTPNDEASKFWIGGAAQHGKVCTVFAQLTVNGKWEGPHVFVVRIRDDRGLMCPGVRIEDNGPKMGLNGVDNGRIWFSNVRVPLDCLLDRYASVTPDGQYQSAIKSVSSRFGITVGGLTTGRMLIAQSAIDSLKIGVCIAIRYALQRPQFNNVLVMQYPTHQLRLFPALANAYAMHIAVARLKQVAFDGPMDAERGKQVHVMSSGIKAASTWYKIEGLQQCRECCGGQGFLAKNKIGPMSVDTNVDATFEGDNTVMMLQVAKALLDDAMRGSTPEPSVPQLWRSGQTPLGSEGVAAMLRYKRDKLVFELAKTIKSAGGARHAAATLDANMDVAVDLGWAYVEALAFEEFVKAIPSAPLMHRAALATLAQLYGVTCVTKHVAELLAAGALPGSALQSLREARLKLCAELMAGKGATVLALCEGFGIPDHCLQAPIAFDWRNV